MRGQLGVSDGLVEAPSARRRRLQSGPCGPRKLLGRIIAAVSSASAPPHGLFDALVRRERRRDFAAGRYANVVLGAAFTAAELRSDVDTGVLAAGADAAHTDRLAEAPADVAWTAAVDLASDSLDSCAPRRREPAPPVALVGASLRHQSLATRVQARRPSTGSCSSAQVLLITSTSYR